MTRFHPVFSLAPALALAALLSAGGCNGREVEPTRPGRRPVTQSIGEEEMVYRIVTNIQRIATLKGKCQVIAIDQSQVVPASPQDEQRRQEGRPFNAVFNKHNLSGVFALDRSTPGVPPRLSFRAEVPGVTPVLQALALGDAFWVKVLNPERGLEDMRSILYRGRFDPQETRSEASFSMRPQDFVDLLLSHELLASAPFHKTYSRETWPDYYILNVMRVNPEGELPWATPLHSRIWVERQNLNVAIHQLYDTAGNMVAEGRFTNYVKMPVLVGEERRTETVRLPRGMQFIWPKDRAIIELRFAPGDILVNQSIPDTAWRPPKDVDAVVRELSPDVRGEFFNPLGADPLPDVPSPRRPGREDE